VVQCVGLVRKKSKRVAFCWVSAVVYVKVLLVVVVVLQGLVRWVCIWWLRAVVEACKEVKESGIGLRCLKCC